jgi:O-acetylhomoserine/O-acetylserine sulfhydrylase-like pyridoxal-dependent enzyme
VLEKRLAALEGGVGALGLSIGTEHIDDIPADLEKGFAAAAALA